MKPQKNNLVRFLANMFGALLLVSLAVYTLIHFVDAIKWFGMPFLTLPDALGIIERPGLDEVFELVGTDGDTLTFELTKPGSYLIYAAAQGGFMNILDLNLTLNGPDGRIPVFLVNRGAKPYDTPYLNGSLGFRFTIEQPGTYRLYLLDAVPKQVAVLGITYDYLTGHEATFARVINLQIVVILLALGILYYMRTYRPSQRRAEEIGVEQLKKRGDFEDFLEEYKQDQSKK